MIFTVGTISFSDPRTGTRSGFIEVCKDDQGNVWLRINRGGSEMSARIKPEVAADVAKLLQDASGPFEKGCAA